MKNRGIVIFLILLAAVIIGIIAFDFLSDRPDKSKPNPYEYSVSEFKDVPDELIKYRETKNFQFGFAHPRGIAVDEDKIYLVGDKALQVIDTTGKILTAVPLKDEPVAVDVFGNRVYVGYARNMGVFDNEGNSFSEWNALDSNSLITSIAATSDHVFVADAGKRRVVRYSTGGKILNTFEGKAASDDKHGFIIPSPYFDLDINAEGELWVVNPGLHELENYKPDGAFRTFWNSTGNTTEGFSGCCNPAHFKFLPDGSFVTSEKGLVRIKVYKPSGEFLCVVAPPEKFEGGEKAPDIAIDQSGNIYALDFDKRIIRVFEKK